MNSDSNSNLEQCTESKLSRVHSAPTHGLGCAQAARALRRVLARAEPYRGPLPGRVAPMPDCVAMRMRSLVCCVAAPCWALCRAQGRAVSQPFWPYRAPLAPYRGACSAVSQCCWAPCSSLSRDTPSSQAALLS